MKCKMCYKWKEDITTRHSEEPTLGQWKSFIYDLADFCENKPQINFAGGEPLMRKEILPLIAYASSLGFETHLATNAYLIDEEKAKAIVDTGLSSVAISLDSMNLDTHDFLRGTKGSFERVMQAIELLTACSNKIKICLYTVISAVNLEDLIGLVKWASVHGRIDGMGFQAITQPFSTPEDEYWYRTPEYNFLWPKDINRVDQIIAAIIGLKKECEFTGEFQIYNPISQFRMFSQYFKNPQQFIKKRTCHLDEQAVNITPTGQVHICFYKSPIGNIKESKIQDMWFSETATQVRRQIKSCRKNCQALVNCNFDEAESYAE